MKHIVGFSGGIDSQACARWVLNHYDPADVILLNSNAGGNEHPLTSEFVAEYSLKIHPVIVIQPLVCDVLDHPGAISRLQLKPDQPLTFDMLPDIYNRFPAKMAQFCTEVLKINPTLRWVKENLAEVEFCRYAGVRRDESRGRRATAFSGFDKLFDCEVFHPIADWIKQMCFDFVGQYGEPINVLYSLGFDRVGCAPCVNSGKEDIRRWAMRFPEMIDKVRRWEIASGKTFFPPIVPGKKKGYNFVDEVVAWAMTDRGGRQFNILNGLELPNCESKFGLCE